ncbi:PREDICTED: thrombospondin type-1 domain-containing protein 4-like, partial [Priapulus caudatus]|uniref:Thrombospondin type-1 domain-containing protein 4-like n=1 Tax=Priapulus caudatus TaxID=37621 RepID=A0ABM1F3N6_PRICU
MSHAVARVFAAVVSLLLLMQEVGCDDIIGSGMRYDYCGVCGGFNTTCQIISGIYTQRNLPVGYNNIAAIPKGACNISIQEMYPSENYLVGSNKLCFQPLIYQTTNLGIKYEYSIPIDKTPASLRHTPAKNPAAPSPLGAPPSSLVHAQQPVYIPPQSDKYPTVQSHTIEAGKPTAPQPQQQQSSAKLYVDSPDQYARDNVKPAYQNSPAAAGRPSPQQQQQQRYAGRGRLASVYSSDASVLAGGQSRPPVYGPWYEPTPAPPPPPPPRGRYRPPPNPRPLPPTVNQSVAITAPHRGAPGTHVNADDVPRRHRPRPQVLSQFQNEGQVVNPPPHYVTPGNSAISNNEVTSHLGKENFSWRVSGLTPCSATCGGDRKSDSRWEPSEWGPCSATCGEGIQTRVARCRERISATLTLTLPSSRCFSLPQPEIVRKCISRSCSLWKEGEWGRCSAECVKGVRSRKIHCLTDTPELGCEGAGKPDTEQACDGGQHCNPHWFTGSWGEHPHHDYTSSVKSSPALPLGRHRPVLGLLKLSLGTESRELENARA